MKKRVLFILVFVINVSFLSCERQNLNPSFVSPIKGIWECKLNGMDMTLDFGNNDVEYYVHTDFRDASAIYQGTYTIQDNDITLEFTSLTTKNSSKIDYKQPEEMPKEAVLNGDSTIIYTNYTFTRK